MTKELYAKGLDFIAVGYDGDDRNHFLWCLHSESNEKESMHKTTPSSLNICVWIVRRWMSLEHIKMLINLKNVLAWRVRRSMESIQRAQKLSEVQKSHGIFMASSLSSVYAFVALIQTQLRIFEINSSLCHAKSVMVDSGWRHLSI